jgi:hypothetical protein
VRAKHEKKEGEGDRGHERKTEASVSEKRMATKEDISDHRTGACYSR